MPPLPLELNLSERALRSEAAERGTTQPHRLFQHRIEDWREIARRRIDDGQHFGGGGLLLQRFA
jgi:hypothetical protein